VKGDEGNNVRAPTDSIRPLVKQPSGPARSFWAREFAAPRATFFLVTSFSCLVVLDAFLTGTVAAAQVPGEARAGILYAITHLHPLAYVILFIVFVLSVVNLAYQGYFTRGRSAVSALLHRGGLPVQAEGPPMEPSSHPASEPRPRRQGLPLRPAPEAGDHSEEGVAGSARVVKRPAGTAARQPTPLDGINHTLPVFAARGANGGAVTDKASEKPALSTEFRFTSAVEVPPADEIQRRDREQLVVSGAVRGSDGKGLGSVIVYLTDERGNRLGQSCRSLPETGEFRVHVNAPGRYMLHGYKRGLVEDSPEQAVLPVESGKIEGYSLRMIPEGCTIHGRIVPGPYLESAADLEVCCVCEDRAVGGNASADSGGVFRILGVPSDAVCHLEVRNPKGELLHRSDPIETARHRELHCELVIPLDTARGDEGGNTPNGAPPPADNHEQVSGPPAPPATGPGS